MAFPVWGNHQNANGNSLLNQRIENLSTDPGTAVEGQIYYNTATKKYRFYNGTAWADVNTGTATGDVSSNTATSVDSEIVVFNGTTGKSVKRFTGSGLVKVASGVASVATSGTDYGPATSALATGLLKNTTGTGAHTIAVAGTDYLTGNSTNTLTNKAFDANGTGNSLANVEVADFLAAAINTSATLASASNTQLPTALAVKTYADNLLGANDAMVFRGGIDASTNPNFPAANAGDTYRITVAGRIGGASGPLVTAGDTIIAAADGLASGTQASVGASWIVLQANVDAATAATLGLVQLATQAETEARTDAVKAVTPADLVNFARVSTGLLANGSSLTAVPYTHGLNKQFVTAQLFDASNNSMIITDTVLTDANTVTFTFATAPASNAFRVVVTG